MTTVTSPAGESIDVVSDDDYLAVCEHVEGDGHRALSYRFATGKGTILASLWHHGAFIDERGGATARLHEVATTLGYNGAPVALTNLMKQSSLTPALERKIKGKRTYAIRLTTLPESWFQALRSTTGLPKTNGHASPEPDAPADDVAQVTHYDETEPTPDPDMALTASYFALPEGLEATAGVAGALLASVVKIIRSGTYTPQAEAQLEVMRRALDEAQTRLAQRLDENGVLRRRLDQALESNRALIHERDGLRARLMQVESNLTAALKGDDAAYVRSKVEHELERIMKARPAERAAS